MLDNSPLSMPAFSHISSHALLPALLEITPHTQLALKSFFWQLQFSKVSQFKYKDHFQLPVKAMALIEENQFVVISMLEPLS